MAVTTKASPEAAPGTSAAARRRRVAWILVLVADAGFVAWGAGAAIAPDHLLGPGGIAILPAGYQGYAHASWAELASGSPMAAGYMAILYRMYGIFNVVFGFMGSAIAVTAFRRGERWAWWTLLLSNTIAFVSAMTYDRIVNAIGPFELSEYLGLALVWVALALAPPFLAKAHTATATPLTGVEHLG